MTLQGELKTFIKGSCVRTPSERLRENDRLLHTPSQQDVELRPCQFQLVGSQDLIALGVRKLDEHLEEVVLGSHAGLEELSGHLCVGFELGHGQIGHIEELLSDENPEVVLLCLQT